MKSKKEDTKLYKGIIGLAKAAAGKTCTYGDYQNIKQYFRYPGELLERMEGQGFTSISDYISVMKGLSRIGKYHTDGTFIGSQLEDFLKRAKEKAVKEQNLILLYQVLAFSYLDPEPATLTGEDITLLLTSAKESSLEDLFEFLSLFFEEERSRYWKENKTAETALIKKILTVKREEIIGISKIPVLEHDTFYMSVISFFRNLKISILRDCMETNFEETFGKDLGQMILVFSALYEEPVKTKNEKFLKNLGYTEMDILNLNSGIWFLNDERTYLQSTFSQDGLNIHATNYVFTIFDDSINLVEKVKEASAAFINTDVGLQIYQHNCENFNLEDFFSEIPNSFLHSYGFEKDTSNVVQYVINLDEQLVSEDDVKFSDERWETLKRELFMNGSEALEEFLGELDENLEKDTIENMLDEISAQMPDEELFRFYIKYCLNNQVAKEQRIQKLVEDMDNAQVYISSNDELEMDYFDDIEINGEHESGWFACRYDGHNSTVLQEFSDQPLITEDEISEFDIDIRKIFHDHHIAYCG